jgi:hypothetical protein
VNSLVLVSHVGSFVMTNQMRGRAIRVNPNDPAKIASVWHLVAVAAETPSGWSDMELLARRFEAFVGLSAIGARIESGLGRLGLSDRGRPDDAETINRQTRLHWAEHASVAARWRSAIVASSEARVVPAVIVRQPPTIRPFWFAGTLRHFLATTASGAGAIFYGFVRSALSSGAQVRNTILFLGCAAVSLWTGVRLARAAWLWRRHHPVDGTLRQIALALHDALAETDCIPRGRKSRVRIQQLPDGVFSATLTGVSFQESALYADCLAEILSPIANPRYLLTRPGRGRRLDYHAVPKCLGGKRKLAEILHRRWRKRLGGGELIYTRTPDGRRALLRARARAFSTAMTPPSQRRDRWQ